MARQYLNRQNAGYRGINALLAVLCPVSAATAPVNAVASTLSTNLGNATNNDLTFTAKRKGTYGDGITIRYVDPGVETATESVAVVGKAITVTLRSVSSVLSTATQVKAAIEANSAANTLVTVANKATNDGTGVVAAMAATNLASGVNGTDADPYQQLTYGGYLYINVTDSRALPGATDTWYRTQLTLVS